MGSRVWAVVAAHGLSCPMSCEISVPRLGIEPVSPPLEGGFWTIVPPGKSRIVDFYGNQLLILSCSCLYTYVRIIFFLLAFFKLMRSNFFFFLKRSQVWIYFSILIHFPLFFSVATICLLLYISFKETLSRTVLSLPPGAAAALNWDSGPWSSSPADISY